jgi:hypothetical protein
MSNNLNLSQIAATQLNKHTTANDQAGQLDAAITEPMAVPVDDTNAVTLTAAEFRRHFLFAVEDDTTPPDDAITLTVPALKRGVFAVRNTTAQTVTVTISGQSEDPPVVLPDEVQLLVCNGTDVLLPAASTAPPYDLLVFFPGTQDDGQLLVELVFVRDVAFPEDLTGSEAHAGAAPAAEAVMKLLKNDVEVGTVTFAMAGQTGTYDLSGGALFEAGDRLAVTAPATADTTLADVTLGLKGVRAS